VRGFCRCSPGRRVLGRFLTTSMRRALNAAADKAVLLANFAGRNWEKPTPLSGDLGHTTRLAVPVPVRTRTCRRHAPSPVGSSSQAFPPHCFGRDEQARAETLSGPLSVRADLVIGADGRHSTVREKAGLVVDDLGAPMDVLWMQIRERVAEVVESR